MHSMQKSNFRLSYLRALKRFYVKFLTAANHIKMTEHTFMLLGALIIGVIGGLGAVLIQFSIKEFQHILWQGDFNLDTIRAIPWYWKLAVPVFGGLVVGIIIQYVAKEAKGHGVPEVMEAIALHNGVIRVRVVIAKLFSSALYIASGGSVGREGPVIQIGSAIGSSLGQLFKVNSKRMRTFVACGAASGIAAAFNAPVAGALFAVEVILGDFAVPQFSPIVVSSVAATVVSRHFLGDFPALIVAPYHLVSPLELLNYVVLGLISGVVAVMFVKTLYFSEDFFDRFQIPEYYKSAAGGLMIGTLGLVLPEVFGIGYDTIDAAMAGHLFAWMALALVFVKILATSISLGSGGSGGIFAPSLFLGAMTGTAFGGLMHYLFPAWTAQSGAYALVGMGGLVAASTHGPITAILIIFELTNDYKIILPLMITAIISTIVASRLQEGSIYTLKLLRRGVNIFAGKEINVLRSIKVADVAKKSINLIHENASFNEILDKMVNSQHNYIYVVNADNKIIGYISMTEIRQTIRDYDTLKDLLIAEDIVVSNFATVTENDNLDIVMKQFGWTGMDEIPVLSGDKKGDIIGTIWQADVIDAYNNQIFLRDMSGEAGQLVDHITEGKSVHVVERYYFFEIEVPPLFHRKSLVEIDVRKNYKLEVLLIKRTKNTREGLKTRYVHPSASTTLHRDDVLLLFGTQEDIKRFRKVQPNETLV